MHFPLHHAKKAATSWVEYGGSPALLHYKPDFQWTVNRLVQTKVHLA